jgi:hypothetical protein
MNDTGRMANAAESTMECKDGEIHCTNERGGTDIQPRQVFIGESMWVEGYAVYARYTEYCAQTERNTGYVRDSAN